MQFSIHPVSEPENTAPVERPAISDQILSSGPDAFTNQDVDHVDLTEDAFLGAILETETGTENTHSQAFQEVKTPYDAI